MNPKLVVFDPEDGGHHIVGDFSERYQFAVNVESQYRHLVAEGVVNLGALRARLQIEGDFDSFEVDSRERTLGMRRDGKPGTGKKTGADQDDPDDDGKAQKALQNVHHMC